MIYIVHFQSNVIDVTFKTRSVRKLNAQCRHIRKLHENMLKHEGFDERVYKKLISAPKTPGRNYYGYAYSKNIETEQRQKVQSAVEKIGKLKVTITRENTQKNGKG